MKTMAWPYCERLRLAPAERRAAAWGRGRRRPRESRAAAAVHERRDRARDGGVAPAGQQLRSRRRRAGRARGSARWSRRPMARSDVSSAAARMPRAPPLGSAGCFCAATETRKAWNCLSHSAARLVAAPRCAEGLELGDRVLLDRGGRPCRRQQEEAPPVALLDRLGRRRVGRRAPRSLARVRVALSSLPSVALEQRLL